MIFVSLTLMFYYSASFFSLCFSFVHTVCSDVGDAVRWRLAGCAQDSGGGVVSVLVTNKKQILFFLSSQKWC